MLPADMSRPRWRMTSIWPTATTARKLAKGDMATSAPSRSVPGASQAHSRMSRPIAIHMEPNSPSDTFGTLNRRAFSMSAAASVFEYSMPFNPQEQAAGSSSAQPPLQGSWHPGDRPAKPR